MWWAVGNLKSLIGLVVEVRGCITWVMGGYLGVSKPIFPIAKKNDLDMKTTPSPPTLFSLFSSYKKPSPPAPLLGLNSSCFSIGNYFPWRGVGFSFCVLIHTIQ